MGDTSDTTTCPASGSVVDISTDGDWVGTCPSCRTVVSTRQADGGKVEVLRHSLPHRLRLTFDERRQLADARLLAAVFVAAEMVAEDISEVRTDLTWTLAASTAKVAVPDDETRRLTVALLAEAA